MGMKYDGLFTLKLLITLLILALLHYTRDH